MKVTYIKEQQKKNAKRKTFQMIPFMKKVLNYMDLKDFQMNSHK